MPWIIGIGLVVVLLAMSGTSSQAGSVLPERTPVPGTMGALPAPPSVRFLGLPVQSSSVPVLSTSPVNPNVIRLEGGTRFAEKPDPNTPNVLFQSGRDPGEAQQPASIIITDNSGALADIDQRIAAIDAPGSKVRLPSVSLGPTIGQQSQGLISFYSGGVDAGGNQANQDLRAFREGLV